MRKKILVSFMVSFGQLRMGPDIASWRIWQGYEVNSGRTVRECIPFRRETERISYQLDWLLLSEMKE